MKHFLIIVFYICKCQQDLIKEKQRKAAKKMLVKGIKPFLQKKKKKEKEKSINTPVKDIEIFLKKKETKRVSMVVKDIKIFQKMKNESQLSIENIIPECKS